MTRVRGIPGPPPGGGQIGVGVNAPPVQTTPPPSGTSCTPAIRSAFIDNGLNCTYVFNMSCIAAGVPSYWWIETENIDDDAPVDFLFGVDQFGGDGFPGYPTWYVPDTGVAFKAAPGGPLAGTDDYWCEQAYLQITTLGGGFSTCIVHAIIDGTSTELTFDLSAFIGCYTFLQAGGQYANWPASAGDFPGFPGPDGSPAGTRIYTTFYPNQSQPITDVGGYPVPCAGDAGFDLALITSAVIPAEDTASGGPVALYLYPTGAIPADGSTMHDLDTCFPHYLASDDPAPASSGVPVIGADVTLTQDPDHPGWWYFDAADAGLFDGSVWVDTFSAQFKIDTNKGPVNYMNVAKTQIEP
jgi:hypothetical protein